VWRLGRSWPGRCRGLGVLGERFGARCAERGLLMKPWCTRRGAARGQHSHCSCHFCRVYVSVCFYILSPSCFVVDGRRPRWMAPFLLPSVCVCVCVFLSAWICGSAVLLYSIGNANGRERKDHNMGSNEGREGGGKKKVNTVENTYHKAHKHAYACMIRNKQRRWGESSVQRTPPENVLPVHYFSFFFSAAQT
jgi:hypothetical protein